MQHSLQNALNPALCRLLSRLPDARLPYHASILLSRGPEKGQPLRKLVILYYRASDLEVDLLCLETPLNQKMWGNAL